MEQNFSREIFTRTWSIYLVDKSIKHIFVFTPSVGVKHFELLEKHVFAYFQCRSSTYMWCVRDLDLGSMINLSIRINKT